MQPTQNQFTEKAWEAIVGLWNEGAIVFLFLFVKLPIFYL
jgi:hypothetical protein